MFHRYHACNAIDYLEIEAEVKNGTKRDAILYSVSANAMHAAVFLVPVAFITGAIAIKQNQELLGILAIALSFIGLNGIIEVSEEIDQATKEIERIIEDPFNVDNIDEDLLIITYDKYQQIYECDKIMEAALPKSAS